MNLRKLELKDAPLMLEWMHDTNVVSNLRGGFLSKTLEDAQNFILDSLECKDNIHLAIVSDTDEYMGTVSLKNIEDGNAEFAITVRSTAMGKGYSWFGMQSILEKAFIEYDLKSVYWCVNKSNARAIRFYDKHNFKETLNVPSSILNRYDENDNLKWYYINKKS